MAKIILWNSIAKRRRSISDTFYDNGLGTLKAYLEERGHEVEIVDCARDDFFQNLSPLPMADLIRRIYARLMSSRSKLVRLLLGPLGMKLQDLLSYVQERRLKKHLRSLAEYVRDSGARVFGVKMWYGEAFTNANWLIKEIQRIAPEIITIAGGYHVTLYEKNLMKRSPVDLGAVCEGEFPLEKILEQVDEQENSKSESRNPKQVQNPNAPMLQTVQSGTWIRIRDRLFRISNFEFRISAKQRLLARITDLADQGKIENLLYRRNGNVLESPRHRASGCSSKSVPSYDMNGNKVAIHVMVESLGCDWGKCSFCVHQHFYPKYSMRAAEEVVAEIKEMQKEGIGIFRFAGSDTPPAFGAKIAQKILDEGLNVIFGMGSRAIRNARNKFESLVQSYEVLIRGGLRAVFMGGETGNDTINREIMNKGVTFDDLVHTIRALREAERRTGEKVYLSLGMIYPTPLMGLATLKEVKADNLRLLQEVHIDSVMITPPGPFVHTDWYKERDRYGFEVDSDVLERAMEYEYVLYKPPEFWPHLGVSLEGRSFRELLAECNNFRKAVENELGIPTDISDEHFLMFYAAGILEKDDIQKAKMETMLDIVACDYRYTRSLTGQVNAYSRGLCEGRRRRPAMVTEQTPIHIGLPIADTAALFRI